MKNHALHLQALINFGLAENEAKTYLALLEIGESTITPISEKASLKRTSVYSYIGSLLSRGLIKRAIIRGRSYYAAEDPNKFLDLIEQQRAQLSASIDGLSKIHAESPKSMRINYLQGATEVRNIVREELNCEKIACYIWPGEDIMEMIGGPKYMSTIDSQRIKKGIEVRTIRFRDKDIPYHLSSHGKKLKRKLRFAPGHFRCSMGLGIYDNDKVGFFSSKKEAFGVLIESKELKELMMQLYDFLWKSSIPASEGEG